MTAPFDSWEGEFRRLASALTHEDTRIVQRVTERALALRGSPLEGTATPAKCMEVSPISQVEHLSGGTSDVHCQLPRGHAGPHRGIHGEWGSVEGEGPTATPEIDDAVPTEGWRISPALKQALTQPRERDLSVRACDILAAADLRTLQAVRAFLREKPDGLLQVRNCGPKIAAFIKTRVLGEEEGPTDTDALPCGIDGCSQRPGIFRHATSGTYIWFVQCYDHLSMSEWGDTRSEAVSKWNSPRAAMRSKP